MTPMARQVRSTRASLRARPRRGGCHLVRGRIEVGGGRRIGAGSYWTRRLRLSDWYRRTSRVVLTRAVQE